jgi:transposase
VYIEAVMTDNVYSNHHSKACRDVMSVLNARAVFIKPRFPH